MNISKSIRKKSAEEVVSMVRNLLLKKFLIGAAVGACAGILSWYFGVAVLINTLPSSALATAVGLGVGAILGELLTGREK